MIYEFAMDTQARPLDVLVIYDLAILGLDGVPGAVVADLKYLTGKHISLPLSLSRAYLWRKSSWARRCPSTAPAKPAKATKFVLTRHLSIA